MKHLFSRSVTLAAISLSVTAAHAVDAYSNKPVGDFSGDGYQINSGQSIGYLFMSSATGSVSSIDVAVNDFLSSGSLPFTVELYSDNSGTLGSLLGSFSGMTTGSPYPVTSGYNTVPVSGVSLTSGSSYWLVAKANDSLYWNWVDGGSTQLAAYSFDGTNYTYDTLTAGVFSVSLSTVPGPTAAVPFALMALRRRRARK